MAAERRAFTGNNRSVTPLDVLVRTRATLSDSLLATVSCFRRSLPPILGCITKQPDSQTELLPHVVLVVHRSRQSHAKHPIRVILITRKSLPDFG